MNFEGAKTKKVKKRDFRDDEKKIIIAFSFFLILTFIFIGLYFYLVKVASSPQKDKEKPKIIPPKALKVVNENSDERPLAIMVDNNIGEGKHAGLQNSFVNYEIIVEGGLTRIMAIYKDEDNTLVGPIRSARHYFLDYALEYDAVYTHFGWSPKAEEDIENLNAQNINGMIDDKVFARDKNISAPHNVFTSTQKLREYFAEKDYASTTKSWNVLNYSVAEINLNEITEAKEKILLANKVTMNYSRSQNREYIYDETSKRYLRFMNGKAHFDKETDNQLNYKNIIIMKVENNQIDSEDRQDLKTVGNGQGYYVTNGYALPISWEKSTRIAKTKYRYLNGAEIKVNDGNTFIQVVPITSNIIFE